MTSPLTLRMFFSDDETMPILDTGRPQAAEAELRKAMKRAGKAAWPSLRKSCAELADGFFDIRLEDILLDGWGKLAEFAACLKRSRENPQERCRCALYDHEIRAEDEPRIDVVCEGKVIAKIPLKISLVATIEGLELDIASGEVTGVKCGSLKATASFSVSNKTVVERSVGPIDLPGRLSFSHAAPPASQPVAA